MCGRTGSQPQYFNGEVCADATGCAPRRVPPADGLPVARLATFSLVSPRKRPTLHVQPVCRALRGSRRWAIPLRFFSPSIGCAARSRWRCSSPRCTFTRRLRWPLFWAFCCFRPRTIQIRFRPRWIGRFLLCASGSRWFRPKALRRRGNFRASYGTALPCRELTARTTR